MIKWEYFDPGEDSLDYPEWNLRTPIGYCWIVQSHNDYTVAWDGDNEEMSERIGEFKTEKKAKIAGAKFVMKKLSIFISRTKKTLKECTAHEKSLKKMISDFKRNSK